MEEGLYESLPTERLHRVLAARPDLHRDIDAVDEGEQPLTIVRRLTPFVERSLRTATTRWPSPWCTESWPRCRIPT